MISNNFHASSVTFSKQNPLHWNSFSRVAQNNNDRQLAFAGTPFLSSTPVSEQFVEKIIL